MDALAHLHYTFTFALFLALDLHLVEDLFELGLGHELLISVLVDHLFARLELDEVVDQLIFGEWVLFHALFDFLGAQLGYLFQRRFFVAV